MRVFHESIMVETENVMFDKLKSLLPKDISIKYVEKFEVSATYKAYSKLNAKNLLLKPFRRNQY